jgi:hypothetical protein
MTKAADLGAHGLTQQLRAFLAAFRGGAVWNAALGMDCYGPHSGP